MGSKWFPSRMRSRYDQAPTRYIRAFPIEVEVTLSPPGLNHSSVELAVPTSPIWPGFAINTIFYATILWLPFAPFQLRRYVRVKRGLCINCGYDLRGAEHAVCPECGVETDR